MSSEDSRRTFTYRALDLSDASDEFRRRFWSKVDRTGECWLWTAHRKRTGYGQFTVRKGSFFTAHAVSYALESGPILPGSHVCHRCDNPPCVRPDHLFLGTARDNALDMFNKGRQGTRHPGVERANAVLNDDAVRYIREVAPRYGYLRDLSNKYGVSKKTIQKVRSHETWRHVA